MDTVKAIVYILAFIAVLFASYYCCRLMASLQRGLSGSKYMKIEDRLILSRDKSLLVVKVGERYLLIGVTNDNTTLVCELDAEDLTENSEVRSGVMKYLDNTKNTICSRGAEGLASFKDIFKKAVKPPEKTNED